jgi:hypothetical protein
MALPGYHLLQVFMGGSEVSQLGLSVWLVCVRSEESLSANTSASTSVHKEANQQMCRLLLA